MSRIGHHLSIQPGLVKTVASVQHLNLNALQIFLCNPKSFTIIERKDFELDLIKQFICEHDITLVIHASYLLNFCNPPSDPKHCLAVDLLVSDLDKSVKCGAIGVVIHMGKKLKMTMDQALKNYVYGLETVLNRTPESSVIILETAAGQGTELCADLNDLYDLYKMFEQGHQKRIKFCIDTCHIFAAGYNIGDPNCVDSLVRLIESKFTWEKIACIHFNDSCDPCGSKKDRHQDIGFGCINTQGLSYFLRIINSKKVPIIMETSLANQTLDNELFILKKWLLEK